MPNHSEVLKKIAEATGSPAGITPERLAQSVCDRIKFLESRAHKFKEERDKSDAALRLLTDTKSLRETLERLGTAPVPEKSVFGPCPGCGEEVEVYFYPRIMLVVCLACGSSESYEDFCKRVGHDPSAGVS